MLVLSLILLSLSAVDSDSHSLRSYTIGVSMPGSGLHEFSTASYVDDQETEIYTSGSGRRIPVAQWVKENENPEYWERRSQTDKTNEALFRYEVKLTMQRFNHTGGFHFVQVINMCVLNDDGSTEAYKQYTYDGKECMYFDTQTGTFIATRAEAQFTTARWNSPDVGLAEWHKLYMENNCIERLKRYIEFGRQDLELRVRPGVKISGRESDGVTKLHCQVYGFHPRAVDVKWMKNGIDQVPTYETTHVLPNPDRTYQIRVTVEVIPQEGDSYSCYVEHSSLEEPLLVKWEPPQDSPRAVIICAVIAIIVLLSVITGVIICRKNRNNHTAVGNHSGFQIPSSSY